MYENNTTWQKIGFNTKINPWVLLNEKHSCYILKDTYNVYTHMHTHIYIYMYKYRVTMKCGNIIEDKLPPES